MTKEYGWNILYRMMHAIVIIVFTSFVINKMPAILLSLQNLVTGRKR
jgi:hypothetical protein